jgi:hypothetical protein
MSRKVITKQFIALLAALIAGCASYSGSGLVPGQSTVKDVEAVMGAPTLVREAADGEKTLWYPRLPLGRESFAARINPDGTLISLEQRLTRGNIAKLRPNQSTAEDVLDILGPPFRVYQYPHMQREAWEYQLRTPPSNTSLYVQLSPDRVVREVFQLQDLPSEGPFFGFR